ncbi:MAG: metallophosphatase, partial [Gracilibacteraceae bacterium]|nr:metallophosphatase [Gracilibacteraceae bacterium]
MKKSDQQSTGLLSAANLRNKIPAMLLCLIMVCAVIFPIMAATAQAAPSQSLAAWNITGAADVTSPTVQATSGAFQQDATLQLIRDGEPYTVSYTSGGVQAGAGGSTAASNLANMADSAWWVANLSATGYKDISVEWRMRSTNTGPRDFKVQYSTDNATWYDANDPTFQNSNDNGANPAITAEVCNFTGAKGKTLPSGADDQGMLYVRWLLTSNTAVNGSIAANGGTNTINNIVISGTPLSEGETDTTEVNILSFNDFHGQVEPAGSNPGAARFAACMNSLAGTYSNAFAVAGGDRYQGSAVSNYYQGKPVSDMLKAMNVAYSSLGNHEFDWGYDKIPQFAEDGNIDFVCSNLFHKGTDNRPAFVKPYAVKEIAGKKIGIIGFIVTETPVLVKAEYAEPFDFRAPGPWLADLVETLKQDGCDAVIALSHDGGTGLAGYGLAGVVNGHSHAYQAVIVGDTAFVQAGYNGRAVGRLQLVFDNETGTCTATPSYVMINSLPADLLDAGMQAQ